MALNSQGRPTRMAENLSTGGYADTFSGSRGLDQSEPLIFERGRSDNTGVDLPKPKGTKTRLGGLDRTADIGLPGLAEPEAMRHYVRLSRKNYAIDLGLYPLGSCTMKHNPRLNEKMARLPGLADIHPMQPQQTVEGAIELMGELAHWLMTLTNTPCVALSPKAGAHGELCGMMAIRAALDARGETKRRRVLVPESAHGTNPATAVQCGFTTDEIPADATGRVDLEALKAKLGDDVAGIMLTNPNTCGLFERDIKTIADLIHDCGGYFYCDGANFNAIVGRVRPGDLGIDAMHINLHKTFSTPHGGGGPGSGPTVFSEALAPFAPVPRVEQTKDGWRLIEQEADADGEPFGRMTAFHGQMGMFSRALTYMLSHGSDGLKQASEDAVLNANYILARLKHVMTPAFDGTCMHEALFDDRFLKDTGVTTLDFAKAMIDEGYHPMTMYFPLVVHGAMLIEPTETESKSGLDRFCDVLEALSEAAKAGDTDRFRAAPVHAPTKRLDETQAARNPVLRWTPPVVAAAE
ncbi:aminomethyl-transferring glycine dehydrogenase subunit GcvPB [Hyphobacterium sp. SN044]|uniref:aminomethyl-transferring glycine dehydrogenase subunit GcvPB n=1 Tax=Hyphobacterium sp. SN044 TaxID=2912575 RepID=UPI001F026280|nr:aminomethyl-transferring glycine dehydrogenase subunit GcvPB [Hyphobacterium sp. SN044]MCF8880909.1 aminomethyl-transferring glycine dehydrogenase subunit GcvPB [Hyphobacterium sp. SN044]